MPKPTRKQKLQREILRTLIPMAPMADFEPIYAAMRSKHMASLDLQAAAYLACITHIRHQHTEYDQLRDEGYDHDSARHFVLEDINDVLSDWGSSKRLSFEDNSDQAE